MTPSKTTPPPAPPSPPPPPPHHHHYYIPIPPQPHDQNCIIMPYNSPRLRSLCNWHIICTVTIVLVAALVYILWPSDPHLKIERLHPRHVQVHTRPVICIDITLNVTLKVHNVDVYSMDYKSLDVAVKYRERKLGHVKSGHGRVRALGSSRMHAEIELECVKVFSDLVFFLEDLARGRVPFDTVTELTGRLGLFFFHFPLKAKVSCEVLVNTNDQTIERQHCHPK